MSDTEQTETTIVTGPLSGAPAEFQLMPYGRIERVAGEPVFVDEAVMESIIRAFKKSGHDMVIDYEHQTEQDPPVEAPAAGWIKKLYNRGKDGLWAAVDWTEKAKEYLRNREYRYFSPVYLVNKKTRRVGEILRVGLTNAPRLQGLKPLTAKRNDSGSGPDTIQAKTGSRVKAAKSSDGLQAEVNRMLGISAEDWEKYNPDSGSRVEAAKSSDGLQAEINRRLGISAEDFAKYGPK